MILGEVYRSNGQEINQYTRFDMASVTKMLATTTVALIALDRGELKLTDKVLNFFDCPECHKETTIKNLLTHTIGIGWKRLYENVESANIANHILNIPLDIPVNSDVLYSCPGFILLGKILEKIYGKSLDVLFAEEVAIPLDMSYTSFLPTGGNIVNSNLAENARGKVNDLNCRFLDGVAGNAGIFSNMCDMKKYAAMLLKCGKPLFSADIFEKATRNYTNGMSESRGLGYLYVDEKYTQTGKLFKSGAIGHCGHTGQSIFVDYRTGLYVIILSDMTLCMEIIKGQGYGGVMSARERIHNAIADDLTEIGIKF